MTPSRASPGRRRPTACCCCATSGSTLVATRLAARSCSSGRTAGGRRAISPSSTARWSRASTAWLSRSEPTSARTSRAWSRACSASSSKMVAGTAMPKAAHAFVVRDDHQRARGAAGVRARDRWVAGRSVAARRRGEAVPARARALPAQDDRRGDRPGIASVLVPDPLALRRPPRPRVLPSRRRCRRTTRLPRRSRCCARSGSPTARGCSRTRIPGAIHFAMEDGDGTPSRWNTLQGAAGTDVVRAGSSLSSGRPCTGTDDPRAPTQRTAAPGLAHAPTPEIVPAPGSAWSG